MGRVEIRRGNPQASLEYLDRAGSLATQLQNEAARASILQASGIAYMRLNRPDEALKRYQESLAIKQKLGDKRGMAASYVQMGEVQKTLGNPAQAEKSYREALTAATRDRRQGRPERHAHRPVIAASTRRSADRRRRCRSCRRR